MCKQALNVTRFIFSPRVLYQQSSYRGHSVFVLFPLGYVPGKACNCRGVFFPTSLKAFLHLSIICVSVPNLRLRDNYWLCRWTSGVFQEALPSLPPRELGKWRFKYKVNLSIRRLPGESGIYLSDYRYQIWGEMEEREPGEGQVSIAPLLLFWDFFRVAMHKMRVAWPQQPEGRWGPWIHKVCAVVVHRREQCDWCRLFRCRKGTLPKSCIRIDLVVTFLAAGCLMWLWWIRKLAIVIPR